MNKALGRVVHHQQGLLGAMGDHRRHQTAVQRQLVQPGLGQRIAARRRNNGRIRRAFGVAHHAVP